MDGGIWCSSTYCFVELPTCQQRPCPIAVRVGIRRRDLGIPRKPAWEWHLPSAVEETSMNAPLPVPLPLPAVATADGAAVAGRHAATPTAPAPQPFETALVRGLTVPLVGGNQVELLQDGPCTHDAMLEAIAAARHHINLESYIFEADGPGEEFARRLVERARAGVQVNVLFDGFGSLLTPTSYFDHLRAHGVHVCEANPLSRLGNLLDRALHLRDHRKLLVVDGRVAFIGGVNISAV
jgi:cardiolipin synthase